MAVHAGRHQLGPDNGRIILRTTRQGVAATAGHDLTLEVTRWSGELTVNDDLSQSGLSVNADMLSLVVREASGGMKPLTDRDRREIVVTARKVLAGDRHPGASFTAAEFKPDGNGGGLITGTLTVAGKPAPFSLQVREAGPDRYHATGEVVQSAHGITPYRGFFGALKVSDAVGVDVDVDLSAPDSAGAAGDQP